MGPTPRHPRVAKRARIPVPILPHCPDSLPGEAVAASRDVLSAPEVADRHSLDILMPRSSQRLRVRIRAWTRNARGSASLYQAWHDAGTRGSVSVVLLPGALNRIAFLPPAGDVPLPDLPSYHVVARSHLLVIPPIFAEFKQDEVTQEELDAELERILALVRRVSAALAPCTQGHFVFGDDGPSTGYIPGASETPENVRTVLSRERWRELLLSVKCASSEEEAARLREDATMQLLSQVLHETVHRCRFRNGQVDPFDLGGEEDAVTTDVITRLLTLLEKLRTHIDPEPGKDPDPLGDGAGIGGDDPTTWFSRLRAIICRQVVYRFQRVAPHKSPWRRKVERVRRAWRDFTDRLERIRTSTAGAAKKRERARKALEKFMDKTKDDRETLEADFDVVWEFGLDEDALEGRLDLRCRGTWKGTPLPDIVH